MKWFLEEKYKSSNKPINYGDGVVFIGSCFSNNIFEKGKELGFKFSKTNHGTIFHPTPIARIISETINYEDKFRIIENQGRYFSWDASNKFYAESEDELILKLKNEREILRDALKSADFLFLTFGTSKSYTKDELVVANCHKIPADQFNVELTDLNELVELYQTLIKELHGFNPDLHIVFTVSPVRHSKDGLIVNNRSKSRLLMLCEELEKNEGVSYFPSYELVIDQLRDYRFYSSDLVHPNKEAIDFVWDRFVDVYFSDETKKTSSTFEKYRLYFQHIPMHEENARELTIRQNKDRELKEFLLIHPEIIW